MSSFFRLLISFRSNKYVVMADISKAFLQVILKLEEDRNRFCIFWEENGQLVKYRFTTILFGLAVSPYILAAVIRHHASMYPDDHCSSLLKNNLYVDNFVYTHSSPEVLREVFNETTSRLGQGGFNLCSWNTNCIQLRPHIEQRGQMASHETVEKRVLWFLYNTYSDNMKLGDFQ